MNPTTCISGLLYLALSGRFIIRNYTGKLKTLNMSLKHSIP
ncbi:hypothetical protein E1A91_D04G123200v1 [Gossypium mustelinum]|uniref:Uncharacterized protein n=1 Tax=Gossypium mustelinum TaxID=34275 RepID=A0A5D2VD46_GOSMU|nr:hypothetical protein E1A91_D04G123200v1 [Gossypium mustelinum]